MRTNHPILVCIALAGMECAIPALRSAEAPTTQPANAPAKDRAVAPTTQPVDLKAAADERHKHLDERWRQFQTSQRTDQRARFAAMPILTTFKPGMLVNFSLSNGMLKARTSDLATAVPARVAVEGNNAVWIVAHPPSAMLANPAGKFAGARPYFSISRFDFDARDDETWQTRLLISERGTQIFAQTIYGGSALSQTAGAFKVRVTENTEMGKPPVVIYTGQAATLAELRAEQPEEFRLYVLPLLARFVDVSFLQPGPTDIYGAFVEIAADQKVTQELEQLIPRLDADDPADRDAASEKMSRLGAPGILAALRMDESGLSEEQKLRLRAFISSSRRRSNIDPAALRRDRNFLLDCLESDDAAVRAAAKADLESQLHQKIDFDATLTGDAAVRAADAVRKQLLASSPPPATQPTTQPVPQPAPQV